MLFVLRVTSCCVLSLLVTLSSLATAADWQVQPGESIQQAIDRAAPGDRIRVARGFYRENLRIEKSLQLIGDHRPTLSGNQQGDTIRVTATHVSIEGFIIRDSGDSLLKQNAGI